RRNLETIAVPDGLVFNPQKHIIEISDLARRAFGVEINKLAALVKNLEKSVGLLRPDQYNVDAVAISNDLVITLLKGIQPGHGDGFHRDAWQKAAALREDYQRATCVARLRGEARLASEKFVDLAGMAIEQVRIFTVTDCADRDQHHAAIAAWKELRAGQLKLANYDQEIPTIKVD
uniref:hypothetical protein n=1 Tax=uncultured Agrobacterium sp. TaxID=157277 RepID=UPI0025D9DA63